MLNKQLEIARLKAQLEWYRNESYASKTIQMVKDRILELETGKPRLTILGTPI